jgi:hypothetical protein
MSTQQAEITYKGYAILSSIHCDSKGKFYGSYEIRKDGVVFRFRENIFPGSFYSDAAREDTVEHAKLEIDNLAS